MELVFPLRRPLPTPRFSDLDNVLDQRRQSGGRRWLDLDQLPDQRRFFPAGLFRRLLECLIFWVVGENVGSRDRGGKFGKRPAVSLDRRIDGVRFGRLNPSDGGGSGHAAHRRRDAEREVLPAPFQLVTTVIERREKRLAIAADR
jgi:hypothetical protein